MVSGPVVKPERKKTRREEINGLFNKVNCGHLCEKLFVSPQRKKNTKTDACFACGMAKKDTTGRKCLCQSKQTDMTAGQREEHGA